MRRRTAGAIVSAWVVGASALATAAHAQDALRQDRPVPSIVAEGEASRDVAPDLAVISIGVSTTRATARDAADQTSQTAKALIATVRSNGITDADVATTETTLSSVYDTPKDGSAPRVRAFQSTNVLAIKVRKLDGAGILAGQLLDQGANDLRGIDFTIADPEPVLDALRADAARNARHRAEIYAGAIGMRLGQVLTIQPETTAQPMPQFLKAAPARVMSESMPLAPGTQRLEVRVSVTWALGPSQP